MTMSPCSPPRCHTGHASCFYRDNIMQYIVTTASHMQTMCDDVWNGYYAPFSTSCVDRKRLERKQKGLYWGENPGEITQTTSLETWHPKTRLTPKLWDRCESDAVALFCHFVSSFIVQLGLHFFQDLYEMSLSRGKRNLFNHRAVVSRCGVWMGVT